MNCLQQICKAHDGAWLKGLTVYRIELVKRPRLVGGLALHPFCVSNRRCELPARRIDRIGNYLFF